MYKIIFDYKTIIGNWASDTTNNNGRGYTLEDAARIACRFEAMGYKIVRIELM